MNSPLASEYSLPLSDAAREYRPLFRLISAPQIDVLTQQIAKAYQILRLGAAGFHHVSVNPIAAAEVCEASDSHWARLGKGRRATLPLKSDAVESLPCGLQIRLAGR